MVYGDQSNHFVKNYLRINQGNPYIIKKLTLIQNASRTEPPTSLQVASIRFVTSVGVKTPWHFGNKEKRLTAPQVAPPWSLNTQHVLEYRGRFQT